MVYGTWYMMWEHILYDDVVYAWHGMGYMVGMGLYCDVGVV